MEAMEIIEYLRERNFVIKTDGKLINLAPAARITEELISRLRKRKPEIIAELKREERRAKVLAMLDDRPGIQRAFTTDTVSDADNVIVAVAVRDVGTCELLIPQHKYDGFLMLELIEEAGIQ